ncbi:hypothetical protein D7V80_36545 [Corallococcus sp. CA054B]|uniref:hypothetical protein n=1 Tax=Corallococcus sp. CA054B TaxID=2316734 RepID=UPI000EA2DB93|nr:hypothetical protein [Corallococcus sp. CA054B]RKG60067.1 hypothetical protein D7V80_36545 [Corallococcus sp. CA054B]
MRKLFAVPVTLFSFAMLACGTSPAPEQQTPAPTQQEQGLNAVGQGCSADTQCATGLCWTEADSYPLYNSQWIRADQCTEECGGPSDNAYCQQLAAEFNAPYPNQARCIPARGVYDNYPYDDIFYVCDLIPAGLGKVHWAD